jgi:hypothetical protein
MAKRFVAASRIAWGKNHLQAGDELSDPNPNDENQRVLIDKVLIPTGQVREMTRDDEKALSARSPQDGTYARRDMVAGRGRRAGRQSAVRDGSTGASDAGAVSVGAMITKADDSSSDTTSETPATE